MYFKRTIVFAIVGYLAFLFVGCKRSNTSFEPLINGELVVDGVNRAYLMYVPSSYDSSTRVPLMLNFHGYGMSDNQQLQMSDMRDLAESENFILIYPQGSVYDGATHWNVGSWTQGSTADDLGFTNGLIEKVASNYSIDLKRIYACGYSNGGFFSQELACLLSEKIAAIGTVGANMSTRTRNNCNPDHPIPVITISGTKDDVVTYDGTDPEGQISHEEVISFWVDFNQTDAIADSSDVPDISTSDGSNVRLFQYRNGNNNVEIEHYKVIDGGHDWLGSYGNMDDINANAVIWNFVSQFDIDGKI